MEDHAHRVLELVRAQRAVPRDRAGPGAERTATRRHRHGHAAVTPPMSLAQAKTRALMAAYGIRHAAPPATETSGCGGSDTHDQAATSLSEERRRELLEARRRIYRSHFSGLHATHGASGRPKLDTLIDAAVDAKRGSSEHAMLAVGAAVLTSADRIYSSGRLESVQDPKFDVCAERAALLKMLESRAQQNAPEVVEAVVICSDQRGLLPVPCGSCREFLADFGDFPVFLLNAENDSRETRSFELFPLARHSTQTTAPANTTAERHQPQREQATHGSNRPLDARDWSCEHVARWLEDVVELPQYVPVFSEKHVDGATLWYLGDSDLQLLLGIVHPLHRRRLLLHLDRIKDRELLDYGIDFGQLQDYVAVLDQDRLEIVAQLKETFDRIDVNRDGLLDFTEFKNALHSLGLHDASAQATQQLLERICTGSSAVTFPMFVRAFSQIAQLPAGEMRDAHKNFVPAVDVAAMRQTFDRADTNKSSSVDETELVRLLQSLGRDQCERRAREWFEAADEDGNGRLSFAEFFLRYTQLMKLDLSAIRRAFDAAGDGSKRTAKALEGALCKLFPHVPPADIHSWWNLRPWQEVVHNDERDRASPTVLSYAEFALACVLYGSAVRLRVAHLKAMHLTLHNDGLCHRSRIVHLQQSGHVRLCRQTDGGAGEERFAALRTRRQAARKENMRARHREDESKDVEEPEHDVDDRVGLVYRRFAEKRQSGRSAERERRDDDSKQHSSDEEHGREARLNAVEAAQALIELGITCSRDQLLRYLDREGFGLRRKISDVAFNRIFKRLKVFQEMPQGLGRKKAVARQKELWDAIGRAGQARQADRDDNWTTHMRHPSRRVYDEFLRTKHRHRQDEGKLDDAIRGRSRRRKERSKELERSKRRSRHLRSSSSSSRSSSALHRRGRRISRSRSCHSRSASNTSTASSTERSSQHCLLRKGRFFRGFEVGDRVKCRGEGPGTLVRLYRDYFVADVRFDSGNSAKNVDLSHLKRLSDGEAAKISVGENAKRTALVVGANVCVSHKGTKVAVRRGTILRCRTNGTYDIVVNEHGEQELLQRVPLSQVTPAKKPVVYSSGTHVTVKRKHEYLRGVIVMCRTNGTYDVQVRSRNKSSEVLRELAWELLSPDEDDGESEQDDDDDEVEYRSRDDARRQTRHNGDGRDEDDEAKHSDDNFEPVFKVGDKVEARFKGQSTFYAGSITRVHTDSTCDVAYDDGDTETRVRESLIRLVSSKATAKTTSRYDDDFESD